VRIGALLGALLAGASGCAIGSPEAPWETTQPADATGLEAAARQDSAALLSGDLSATFRSLSVECQQQVGDPDTWALQVGGATRSNAIHALRTLGDAGVSVAGVEIISIDDAHGNVAIDFVDAAGAPLDLPGQVPQTWVHDEEAWRRDGCA
jgi:hypothetical protein